MIQPGDIKKEALRWYFDFLVSSMEEIPFFPKEVRFGKIKPSETLQNFSKINKDIEKLQDQSKNKIGYGYQIEFVKRKDHKIGEQLFPGRIYFETQADYLKFIDMENEFENFFRISHKIIAEIPKLKTWIIKYPQKVVENLTKWDDLLKVCKFFIQNPKPHIYMREIPLDISTKFIEENQATIRILLDILIEEYCNKNENEFEKRFNLKYNERLIRIRILDNQLSQKFFLGIDDLSVPHSQLVSLNFPCKNVFILENHTNFSNIFNFLTLPYLEESIAIFGKGFQIGLLKDVEWLSDKKIIYWGDIDVHGFQILSQIRGYFPNTCSCMMDLETFNEFRNLAVTGAETTLTSLAFLKPEEHQLFVNLLEMKENNRLEQEKIPHSYAIKKIHESLRIK
jgi:hypothetical protein